MYLMFYDTDRAGDGQILGLFYDDNPRLCLYSAGLKYAGGFLEKIFGVFLRI